MARRVRPTKILKATGLTIGILVFAWLAAVSYFELSMMTYTATHARRTFLSRDDDVGYIDQRARLQLEQAYGLHIEGNGGLRVQIDRWPSLVVYLAIGRRAHRAAVLSVPYRDQHGIRGRQWNRSANLDKWQIDGLLSAFDRRSAGYLGTARSCLDGTGLSWERWQDGKVLGGSGNAACMAHYADLEALLAAYLSRSFKDAPFEWSD